LSREHLCVGGCDCSWPQQGGDVPTSVSGIVGCRRPRARRRHRPRRCGCPGTAVAPLSTAGAEYSRVFGGMLRGWKTQHEPPTHARTRRQTTIAPARVALRILRLPGPRGGRVDPSMPNWIASRVAAPAVYRRFRCGLRSTGVSGGRCEAPLVDVLTELNPSSAEVASLLELGARPPTERSAWHAMSGNRT